MPRCAFLTLDDPTGWVMDDDLTHPHLHALGWQVDTVSWRAPERTWRDYDAVVIRSTWDYHEDSEAFLEALAGVERTGTPLHNPLALVRWNARKTYLRELAARGVPVVPTVWRERLRAGELASVLAATNASEVVIKPVVSASAKGAFRLDRETAMARAPEIEAYYADRALLAQPFLPAVVDEGEFSLMYFNGAHSHTILKTPKAGDFRVQEEHGGDIRAVSTEPALHTAGDRVLAAIGEAPLYARADFVRTSDGEFMLMELELIEPSLYFRTDPESAERFARALAQRFR
jgi:glutathione synthase/RimK-type ligase-like ATP-grasp enzyme